MLVRGIEACETLEAQLDVFVLDKQENHTECERENRLHWERNQYRCAQLKLRMDKGEEETGKCVNRADCIVCIRLQIGLAEEQAEDRGHCNGGEDRQIFEQVCFVSQQANRPLIEALVVRPVISLISTSS